MKLIQVLGSTFIATIMVNSMVLTSLAQVKKPATPPPAKAPTAEELKKQEEKEIAECEKTYIKAGYDSFTDDDCKDAKLRKNAKAITDCAKYAEDNLKLNRGTALAGCKEEPADAKIEKPLREVYKGIVDCSVKFEKSLNLPAINFFDFCSNNDYQKFNEPLAACAKSLNNDGKVFIKKKDGIDVGDILTTACTKADTLKNYKAIGKCLNAIYVERIQDKTSALRVCSIDLEVRKNYDAIIKCTTDITKDFDDEANSSAFNACKEERIRKDSKNLLACTNTLRKEFKVKASAAITKCTNKNVAENPEEFVKCEKEFRDVLGIKSSDTLKSSCEDPKTKKNMTQIAACYKAFSKLVDDYPKVFKPKEEEARQYYLNQCSLSNVMNNYTNSIVCSQYHFDNINQDTGINPFTVNVNCNGKDYAYKEILECIRTTVDDSLDEKLKEDEKIYFKEYVDYLGVCEQKIKKAKAPTTPSSDKVDEDKKGVKEDPAVKKFQEKLPEYAPKKTDVK